MVVIRSSIRIPDHFSASLSTAEYGIVEDLLVLIIPTGHFHET